jgi:hypothetical protein
MNVSRVEFWVKISQKYGRIKFSDIHNPTVSFLHWSMSFTLFPMRELHSVTVAGLKCMYAIVHKIRYTLVADMVDYFKKIRTMARPTECTSMIIQIALNLGYPEMAHMSCIKEDVLIWGHDNFVHMHILCEELDCTMSMMYEGGNKALRLPNLTLALYSYHQLTLQLTLDSVLPWRQHSRTPPHHRLPLCSPVGTLGMRVDTWSTRRVVVSTTQWDLYLRTVPRLVLPP